MKKFLGILNTVIVVVLLMGLLVGWVHVDVNIPQGKSELIGTESPQVNTAEIANTAEPSATQATAKPNTTQTAKKLVSGSTNTRDINFKFEQTGTSSGRLTIFSTTSESWKFGPWVGGSTTVTMTYADGSIAYAQINTDKMYFTYGSMFFQKGCTYVFDLSFNGKASAAMQTLELDIASYLKNVTVKIPLQ